MGVALPPSATRSHEPKVVSSKDTGSLENAIQNPKKATTDKEVEEVRFPSHLRIWKTTHPNAPGLTTIRLSSVRGVPGAEVALD